MHRIFSARVIIPVILVIGSLVTAYFLWFHPESANKAIIPTNQKIDYGPATTAQKNSAGVNNKDAPPTTSSPNSDSLNTSGSNTSTSAKATKKNVTVLITTWAQKHGDMTVNGYVDGVVESNGTCTLTLRKGGITKTVSRPGHANATNTTCGENDIPITSLSPGTWQATLSYSSPTASGSSDSQPVEVTQ